MGKPEIAVVNALGLWSPQNPGRIQRLQILGYDGEVQWPQDNASLSVKVPANILSNVDFTLKVDLA